MVAARRQRRFPPHGRCASPLRLPERVDHLVAGDRLRRRGDRIAVLFLLRLRLVAIGTKRTYRGVCCLSAFGGKRTYALALNGHIEPTCACPLWRAKADFGGSVMTRS